MAVRNSQDITLVVGTGNPNVRVSQDITLVLYTRPTGNATQLMSWTDPGFGARNSTKRNIGLYQQASVPVFVTNKVFPIIFCVT